MIPVPSNVNNALHIFIVINDYTFVLAPININYVPQPVHLLESTGFILAFAISTPSSQRLIQSMSQSHKPIPIDGVLT
jgi:hypothetical protein